MYIKEPVKVLKFSQNLKHVYLHTDIMVMPFPGRFLLIATVRIVSQWRAPGS